MSRSGPSLASSPSLQNNQDMVSSEGNAVRRAALEMRDLVMSGNSDDMSKLRNGLMLAGQDTVNEWKLGCLDWQTSLPQVATDSVFRSVARRISGRFKFVEFSMREVAVAQSVLETYSWMFNRAERPQGSETTWSSFPDWLERPEDPIYWITGKPGAGKSTIMKYILGTSLLKDHLTKWAGQKPLLIARYYAWHAGTTPQKSLWGLKQALLYQVLEEYPELIPVLAPAHWAQFWLFGFDAVRHQAVSESDINHGFDRLMAISGTTISLAIFIDGLDEFDMPPREVVSFVESIATSSRKCIKICVASRPWVEFDDAYSESPKLQMDLYTGNDMEIFVAERFRKCRAFKEISAAHPSESMNLQRNLAKKANGVFIWLSLVVNDLELAATDGAGILELEEIADRVPSEMCSLYDFIWRRIPEQNRQRGAALIQTVEVADFKLNWQFAWLVDELAQRGHDISPTILHSVEDSQCGERSSGHIRTSLKRKLSSRTRGIIVDSEGGDVDFTHRTAREWAVLPNVWASLQQESGPKFDPNLLLLEAFTVQLDSKWIFSYPEPQSLWRLNIERALQCASRVSDSSAETLDNLIRALDALDTRVPRALTRMETSNTDASGNISAMPPCHWSARYFSSDFLPNRLTRNTFIHVAAQFALLPYLKAKNETQSRLFFQSPTTQNRGILEVAIFGSWFFDVRASIVAAGDMDTRGSTTTICEKSRLETIKFLLEIGIDQLKTLQLRRLEESRLAYEWRLISLRDLVSKLASDDTPAPYTPWYFSEVSRMLGNNILKTTARVAAMQIKSRWG